MAREWSDSEVSAFLAWWHATPPESPPDYRTAAQRALDDVAAQTTALRQYWQDFFRPFEPGLSCSACFDIAPGLVALGHELSGSRIMMPVLLQSGRVELLARPAALGLFDDYGLAAALVELWRVSRVAVLLGEGKRRRGLIVLPKELAGIGELIGRIEPDAPVLHSSTTRARRH